MSTQQKATQATTVPSGTTRSTLVKVPANLGDSRKQFAIPDDLWNELKISNIRRSIGMPQALREAVENYLKKHATKAA